MFLNFYLLLLADYSMINLKVCLSSPYSFPFFEHFIEAALGAVYIKANYPKDSPT